MEEVYAYLETLQTVDLSSKIDAMQGKIQQNIEADIKNVKTQISKAEKELGILNDEIVKTLTNESKFTSAQLHNIITKKEDEIDKLKKAEATLVKELSARLREVNPFVERQEMIVNWRNELESADLDVQKMFLSKLIDSVVLSRDGIDVNFKFDLFDLTREGNGD